MDKEEIQRIRKFTSKMEIDKAFRTLEGMLKGIMIDKKVNIKEMHELKHWCGSHYEYINKHPFDQAIPMIMGFVEDNELDADEIEDLIWFAQSITGNSKYYDAITSDLQILQGIVHGILADNIVTEEEVKRLHEWLESNNHLRGMYPYDEMFSIVENVLKDNVVSKEEAELLKAYFFDFVGKDDTSIDIDESLKLKREMHISGICAFSPNIIFENSIFCFTGASDRAKRAEIEEIVIKHGAKFSKNVVNNLDYLIVGNAGNPCWAFSCYGRKVEQAMKMRKEGNKVIVVNENDFWKVV